MAKNKRANRILWRKQKFFDFKFQSIRYFYYGKKIHTDFSTNEGLKMNSFAMKLYADYLDL